MIVDFFKVPLNLRGDVFGMKINSNADLCFILNTLKIDSSKVNKNELFLNGSMS